MSLVNPCNIALTPSNTGSECSDALRASSMIIMVPKNWSDTLANIQGAAGGFTAYFKTKVHAVAAQRWFPIFGNSAPIRQIVEANEADVIETLEDGSQQFIRYGMFNRTFLTTEGGFCLAKNLMAMRNNYSFIEVDITGQIAMMLNADGTYSGFPVNLAYAPVPELANLKTSYKNKFMLSFSPNNYIKKGKVFGSSATEDVLSVRGLFDTDIYDNGTQSATHIFIGVKTDCGETDLIDLYGATLAVLGNFVIKNHATGAVVTPSAIAIGTPTALGAVIDFTGVFTSGQTFDIYGAAPSVWKAAGIEGYEVTGVPSIVIP